MTSSVKLLESNKKYGLVAIFLIQLVQKPAKESSVITSADRLNCLAEFRPNNINYFNSKIE